MKTPPTTRSRNRARKPLADSKAPLHPAAEEVKLLLGGIGATILAALVLALVAGCAPDLSTRIDADTASRGEDGPEMLFRVRSCAQPRSMNRNLRLLEQARFQHCVRARSAAE